MDSLVFRILSAFLTALIYLVQISHSIVYAQASSLQQCGEKYLKAKQALETSKPANQSAFTFLFDPNEAKRRQISQEWAECVKGQSIPSLRFKTLDGESYEMTTLSGKITVVNFWFMGCVPCRQEMPALNRLVNEYQGKDVLFLGFATDRTEQLTPAYFAKNRFDFKIIGDASSIAKSFFVLGYPTTFVVDGQGIIRDMWMGVGLDKLEPYYKAKATIDKLLAADKK